MKSRISPSLAVSVVAVVIASAGSATAATVVTGGQIKNGTVTGKDIRNRSITPADIKPRSVKTRNLAQATVSQLQETIATARGARTEVTVITPEAYDPKPAQVYCPEGQVALGGGGGFVERPEYGGVGSNRPILDTDGVPRGWQVAGNPGVGENKTLEAYVICSP